MYHDSWAEWEDLSFNLPSPSVRAFAVDPTDHDRIVVGTGDHRRYSGAGIYYTINSGDTWVEANTPIDTDCYYRIYHHPDDYDDMLAAGRAGMLLSTDRGENWALATLTAGGTATGSWTDLVPHPTNSDTWYACRYVEGSAVGRGVFRSLDGGQTWTQLIDADLPTGGSFDRASIAICRDHPLNLAIVVENDNEIEGVYSSTDGGNNWSSIGDDLVADSFGSNQIWHAQAIAIHPTDPDEIYVGAVGLARSLDGGGSWDIGSGDHGIEKGHADFTQLYYSPVYIDDIVFFCNDGGIYWYDRDSGDTQGMMGNSTNGIACSEVDFMDSDRELRAIGLQDNGIMFSIDGGGEWTAEAGGDGADVEITDPVDRDYWYVNGVYGAAPSWRVYKKDWGSGGVYTANPNKYMLCIFHDPFTDTIYTHAEEGLWSRDVAGNDPWVKVVDGFQPLGYSTRSFWGSKANGRVFYFTYWNGDNGDAPDLTVVRRSGANWIINHLENFNPSGDSVQTVCTSSEWPGEAWVGVRGNAGDPKIYHLLDYGNDVTDITNNLADVNMVNCIVAQPFNPDVLYVGTDLGMFRSTDGGQNWDPYMDGLAVGKCSELRYVLDDNGSSTHQLILAMDGRGIWSRSVVSPPVIYVDKDNGGSEDGTFENPYDTVAEGVDAAPAGAIVAIRTNTYEEPQTISKNVRLVTWAGTSVIE